MNKKEFKTKVVREDEYWISIDTNIWDEARMAEYSKAFTKVQTPDDLARILGFMIMRNGTGKFFEGFGYVKTFEINGTTKVEMLQFQNGRQLDDTDYCEGIAVFVQSADQDIIVNVSRKEVFI